MSPLMKIYDIAPPLWKTLRIDYPWKNTYKHLALNNLQISQDNQLENGYAFDKACISSSSSSPFQKIGKSKSFQRNPFDSIDISTPKAHQKVNWVVWGEYNSIVRKSCVSSNNQRDVFRTLRIVDFDLVKNQNFHLCLWFRIFIWNKIKKMINYCDFDLMKKQEFHFLALIG